MKKARKLKDTFKVKNRHHVSAGFAFTNVLGAVAIVGLLSASIASMGGFASKVKRTIKLTENFNSLVTELKEQFDDHTFCTANLKGQIFNPQDKKEYPVTVFDVNDMGNKSTMILKAGQKIGAITVTNVNLKPLPGTEGTLVFQNTPNTELRYLADLEIQAILPKHHDKSHVGSVNKYEKFPIHLVVDQNTNEIIECAGNVNGKLTSGVQDRLCSLASNGQKVFSAKKKGCYLKYKIDWITGNHDTAKCSVGVPVKCGASNYSDTNKQAYELSRQYEDGSSGASGPPAYAAWISNGSCHCVWAIDANTGGGKCRAGCLSEKLEPTL